MSSNFLPKIVISPAGQQFSNQKHNNLGDDYLRLISSQTGKYLASISVKRQLTLFDLNNKTQFRGWSEQNVSYVAFSEKEDQFIAMTRTPSIKLFGIRTSEDQKTKTIDLVKEIKPESPITTYGWVKWSLDNQFLIYVKNQDLFVMNLTTFEELPLSSENDVKSKCIPQFLLLDRATKELTSCSRSGQICTYSLSLPSRSDPSTKPSVKLVKSIKLSQTPIIIGDLNEGKQFLMANSIAMTQNRQNFYSTFIISKQNPKIFWRTRLEQELMSPPLMVQADNIEDYILTFLKGEKSLYIYHIHQIISSLNSSIGIISNNNSQPESIRIINPKQKIPMPYLLHSLNYNEESKKLLFGITSTNNQDKIIPASFIFNCSSILQNQPSQNQLNQSCTTQCQSINQGSYFSFLEGKCVENTKAVNALKQNCLERGKSYWWDEFGERCQLMCGKVQNSVGGLSYGIPSQCLCQQDYLWLANDRICQSIFSRKEEDKTQLTNTTTNSNKNSTTNSITNTTANSTTNNSMNDTSTKLPVKEQNKIIPNSTIPAIPAVPTIPLTPTNPLIPKKTNDSTNTKNNTNPFSNPIIFLPQTPQKTPPIPNDNPSQLSNSSSNNSLAIVLSILIVIIVIGIAVFIYLFKKKKLCFKSISYVEDNQFRLSDIRSNEQFVNYNIQKDSQNQQKNSQNEQKNTIEDNSDNQTPKPSAQTKPELIQSPSKIFNFNSQISKPVDKFDIEEIISESNDIDQPEYRADSQRKF